MSELESIEHYTGIIRGRLVDIERKASDQQEKVKKLQAERDQLKAERDGLNRDQTELAARVDELKAQLANQATVPRVITANELKSWQCVAVGHNGHWRIIEMGDHIEEMDRAEILDHFSIYPGDTIVLLEDAPAEEPEPVKVGDTVTWQQLESLRFPAVILDADNDPWVLKQDGWWYYPGDPDGHNAEELMDEGPFTVMSLPEEDA